MFQDCDWYIFSWGKKQIWSSPVVEEPFLKEKIIISMIKWPGPLANL